MCVITKIKISKNEWRHWNLCLFNRACSIRQVTSFWERHFKQIFPLETSSLPAVVAQVDETCKPNPKTSALRLWWDRCRVPGSYKRTKVSIKAELTRNEINSGAAVKNCRGHSVSRLIGTTKCFRSMHVEEGSILIRDYKKSINNAHFILI